MNVNEGVGAQEVPAPSLWELTKVYLGISLLGFGGPNAHLALMLDEIVERRGWLTRERFLELVAVTNLLPGPNSSEVAIHVGYTQRGWMGAMATGLAFLLPTFFMVTGLSALYFEYGAQPSVEGLFWGIQPVIVAIVVSAGVKIGRAAVTNRWQVVFALCGAAVSLVSGPAIIVMMVVAGAVAMWLDGEGGVPRPTAHASSLALVPALWPLVGAGGMLSVFLTHLWIGSVLFGGGYVLVALLEPYAVGHYGWLDSGQFLDGVALTQAVPGPISTLSAFVGYAAAGVPGAVLGTLGIYLPAFASVLMSAPRLERLRDVPRVRSALRGVVPVTAGAVFGVGAGLTVAGVRDPLAGVLAIGALAATVRWQVSSLRLMGAGLCAGVLRMVLS
jgi:chromate transporter